MRLPLLVAASVLAAGTLAAEQARTTRPAVRTTTVTRTVSSDKSLWYGPHASFADDSDLGLGARAPWSFTNRRPVALITSFDYFFPSTPTGLDAKHWEVNGNMAYHFGRRWRPYVGPGLNLARRTATFTGTDLAGSDTSVGMNVLGGVRRVEGRKRQYFAEARYELGGGEQFLVTAGVLF